MFKPMRRSKQLLSNEECKQGLTSQNGVFSLFSEIKATRMGSRSTTGIARRTAEYIFMGQKKGRKLTLSSTTIKQAIACIMQDIGSRVNGR